MMRYIMNEDLTPVSAFTSQTRGGVMFKRVLTLFIAVVVLLSSWGAPVNAGSMMYLNGDHESFDIVAGSNGNTDEETHRVGACQNPEWSTHEDFMTYTKTSSGGGDIILYRISDKKKETLLDGDYYFPHLWIGKNTPTASDGNGRIYRVESADGQLRSSCRNGVSLSLVSPSGRVLFRTQAGPAKLFESLPAFGTHGVVIIEGRDAKRIIKMPLRAGK